VTLRSVYIVHYNIDVYVAYSSIMQHAIVNSTREHVSWGRLDGLVTSASPSEAQAISMFQVCTVP